MKKFIALIGIVCILAGLKIMSRGIKNIASEGDIFYDYGGGYVRLDSIGSEKDAEKAVKEAGAKIVFTERLTEQGITLIYAYSPYITKYETVKGKKINIMAAVTKENKIAYGTPLLLGSY